MNKESYAALTPSQKAIFDKHTGKAMSLKAAKIFDDWSEASRSSSASDSKKVEVIQLPPDGAQGHARRSPAGDAEDARRLEKDGIKDAESRLRRDQQVTAAKTAQSC